MRGGMCSMAFDPVISFQEPITEERGKRRKRHKNQEVCVLSTCALGLPLQVMKELIIWTFYRTRGDRSKEMLFANCFLTLLLCLPGRYASENPGLYPASTLEGLITQYGRQVLT